jgi:hypothetical protein
MPKAPLYTVANPAKEPRFAEIGISKEPIDAGRSKELPISEGTAVDLAAQGFKVTDPSGKTVSGKKAKAD